MLSPTKLILDPTTFEPNEALALRAIKKAIGRRKSGEASLPEIAEKAGALEGYGKEVTRQTGLYKRVGKALKALADRELIEREDATTDSGRIVLYRIPEGVSIEEGKADVALAPLPDSAPPAAAFAFDARPVASLKPVANRTRNAILEESDRALDAMIDRGRSEIEQIPDRLSPEEAIRYVSYFDAREAHYSDAGHLERFKLGVVARRVSETANHGDGAMDALAEVTGIDVATIRQCRRLATKYNDNLALFARFLKGIRKGTGKPARWYHVEKVIGTFSDPTVLGPEELARRVVSGLETAADRVAEVAGDHVDETTHVVLTDAARDLREKGLTRLAEVEATIQVGESVVPIPRDPIFLRFVSRLPCVATGTPAPEEGWGLDTLVIVANDPHHVGTGGKGIKGSDYTALPLCREAHDFYHAKGLRAFEKKYGVNVAVALFQTLHLYVAECEADLPSALFN